MPKTIQRKTEKIAAIIEKRRPVVGRIESVEEHLDRLAKALLELQQHCAVQSQKTEDSNIRNRLDQINVAPLRATITAELQALSQLKKRFARTTLNIGVIGRARQGKSRLLQSLSGLTADEIPDGDGMHCTGVRSTIIHKPTTDAYGEVCFHSEQSFLEDVVAPYYDQLNLGQAPISIKAFAHQALPALPKELSAYAEPGAMYEHLNQYHTCFEKYAHLLGVAPRRITRSEIREYVAQDNADGQRVFFNYLAVKEVKITCLFPHEEVGQIALVDMPGLGDTGVGDESRLVQTLGQDVDIVLFVRMPKPGGDHWADVDVSLYDIARKALPMLPLELWSFMVLNRTATTSKLGDNAKNCENLKETMAEKHIEVAQQMTTNCADDGEAEALLDSILQYMAENITQLDCQYASACQASLHQIQQSVQSELEKAHKALGEASFQTNWLPLFETLFRELSPQLAHGLESLLKELRERRYQPDFDFKKQVDAALKACKEDTGLPTLEEIELRRADLGGYPPAYYAYLSEIRARLSQQFLVIDEALTDGIKKIKSQVANTLIEQGRLGDLTEVHDDRFLDAIIQQIPDQLVPGESSQIKFGFQILDAFTLSYRGLIQHRIRKNLDDLTPDLTQLQLSDEPSASEVLSCLTSLQAEAAYKCRTALDDLLDEPSQAAFAIVEEFVDRVLRVENADAEWRIFLAEKRTKVWPEQFGQLEERSRTYQAWLETVEQVVAVNQTAQFTFLD